MVYQPILDLTTYLIEEETGEKVNDSRLLRSIFTRKMMLVEFCLQKDGRILVIVRGTKKQLLSWINGYLNFGNNSLADDDETDWSEFSGALKLVA